MHNLRVNKLSSNGELIGAILESLEAHDTVSYYDGFKIDIDTLPLKIMSVDLHCKVRDVLASV